MSLKFRIFQTISLNNTNDPLKEDLRYFENHPTIVITVIIKLIKMLSEAQIHKWKFAL